MDVTCERCQTEYEFDETLISDRGTTVKCTHCGHLFKIFRKGSGVEGMPGPGGRVWTLRKHTGETLTFDRLTTLQQWIIESRVERRDEISRTGEVWKQLGAIAELATFFAAADAASQAAPSSPAKPAGPRKPRTPPLGFATAPTVEGPLPGDAGRAATRDPTQRGMAQTTPLPTTTAAPTMQGVPTPAATAPTLHAPPPVRPPKATMLGVAPAVASTPGAVVGSGAAGMGTAKTIPASPQPVSAPAAPPPVRPGGPPRPQTPPPPPRVAPAPPAPAAPPPAAPPPPAPAPAPAPKSVAVAAEPRAIAQTREEAREAAEDILDGSTVPTVRESFDDAGLQRAVAVVEPGGELGAVRASIAPQPAWADAAESLGATPLEPEVASEEPRAPRRSNNRAIGIVVALVLLVGCAVLAGPALLRMFGAALGPAPETVPTADRCAELVAHGREQLLGDTESELDAAVSDFQQALGVRQGDARALAGLGETLAVQAQYLRDRATDLEEKANRVRPEAQPAESQGELRAQAKILRDGLQGLVARARGYADDAVRAEPSSSDARRALADALRLAGDLPGARVELAKALGAATSAENRYANAMMSLETPETRAQARGELQDAVVQNPRMIRALLRLARLDALDGDVARARTRAEEVLRLHPDHPRAKALLAALDSGDPPVTPVVIAAGEAPPTAVPPPEATPTEPVPPVPPPTTPTPPTGPGPGTPPPGVPSRNTDGLVAEGERHMRSGQVDQARRAFELALQAQPSRSEALAGLGFVLLRMGDNQGAMTQFRRLTNVNPSYAPAYFGMGQAAQRAGQTGVAAQNYRRFLEFPNASGDRAETARRFLDSLGGNEPTPEPAPTAPPTPPDAPPPTDAPLPPDTGTLLPAPRDTPPGAIIPQSDAPAVDSEPPGLPPIRDP